MTKTICPPIIDLRRIKSINLLSIGIKYMYINQLPFTWDVLNYPTNPQRVTTETEVIIKSLSTVAQLSL